MELDKTQPYGTICGRVASGAKYTQFNLDFDKEGKLLTKSTKDVTAAKKLIDEANTSTPVVTKPEPALDVQAVRFVHSGAGKYDVFGTDGSLMHDNITLEEAQEIVPDQIDGENLAFLQRSILIAKVNGLGGKVKAKDTSAILIKKIKELIGK